MVNKWKLPTKSKWMETQMKHEPTRDYAEQIYHCVKQYKPDYKNALEIGAAWGVSSLSILLAGDGKLTSVDSDPTVKAPNEVSINGFSDRYKFINDRSEKFYADNKEKFDIVYVDGGHTYDLAHLDIQECWKILKPGGLMIVDDVVHKYNKEVHLEALEPHYGVAIAVMEHIVNNNITQIGTSSKIWWTVKEPA